MLVLRVAEREQQADRARIGAARAHLLHRLGDGVGGGLGDRLPVRAHPLVDLEAAATLDERRRVVLDEGIHVRARLPADLQQVAEAPGGDHHDVAPAALDERVGAYGGAVGQPPQPGEVDPVPGGQCEQPVDDRPGGVVGGRGPLAGMHRAARLVEHVEVGEGAADVHTDPVPGPGFFLIYLFLHILSRCARRNSLAMASWPQAFRKRIQCNADASRRAPARKNAIATRDRGFVGKRFTTPFPVPRNHAAGPQAMPARKPSGGNVAGYVPLDVHAPRPSLHGMFGMPRRRLAGHGSVRSISPNEEAGP